MTHIPLIDGYTFRPKSFAQKSLSPEDKQFLEKAYMDQFDMRLKEKHPDTFLVVELNTAATKFVANNSIVSCPLIEERTELKYQLEAVEDKLGFETVRRAGQGPFFPYFTTQNSPLLL